MKIPAASALLALLCFLIPAAAESDTNLRYQLEMQRAQTRDAQEQASRERGARMDLQRELTKARDSSASVGAALSKQAAEVGKSRTEMRGVAEDLSDQVRETGDQVKANSEIGERTARAADKSVERSQIISDRQLTQIWGLVIVILGLIANGLRSWRKENKTHDLVKKVEVNGNGHMAALIQAKDDLLAASRASAESIAASEAAHRALLEQQIEQLRRMKPDGGMPAKRKAKIYGKPGKRQP